MAKEDQRKNTVWQVIAADGQSRAEIGRCLLQSGFVVTGHAAPPPVETNLVYAAIKITVRQREALESLLLHDESQEIAAALGTSTKAVDDLIQRLEDKFDVRSRHRLIARVLSRALITLPPDI